MKKKWLYYIFTAAGLLLLAGGLFVLKAFESLQGFMRAAPYIGVGIGCGLFGHGIGGVLSRLALRKSPDVEKQLEIEEKDERNIAIRSRAKGKAFDLMVYVFSALMISFAIMGVELAAVLLLVFAYLFVIGCFAYHLVKYEKEM